MVKEVLEEARVTSQSVSTGSGGLCRKGWKVEFLKVDFLGKESACSEEAFC